VSFLMKFMKEHSSIDDTNPDKVLNCMLLWSCFSKSGCP
jgi:hypothetical protein